MLSHILACLIVQCKKSHCLIYIALVYQECCSHYTLQHQRLKQHIGEGQMYDSLTLCEMLRHRSRAGCCSSLRMACTSKNCCALSTTSEALQVLCHGWQPMWSALLSALPPRKADQLLCARSMAPLHHEFYRTQHACTADITKTVLLCMGLPMANKHVLAGACLRHRVDQYFHEMGL